MSLKMDDINTEAAEVETKFKMKPRPYQVELFKKAAKDDSIIFLGTGSGKTFIAVMMIREHLPHILNSNKKVVFLVNTVVLAHQQCSFINKHVPVAAKSFCGVDGVDDWDEFKWRSEKSSCKIMVMISAVFRDALLKRFISEEEVSLLIFDECHHSKKNSPYAQILKVINEADRKSRPRVLGLSASLVNTKSNTDEKFLKELNDLESIMKCKAVTTEENLASYLKEVNIPTEICEYFDHFEMDEKLLQIFVELEMDALSLCVPKKDNKKSKIHKMISRMKTLIQNLGLNVIGVLRKKDDGLLAFEEDFEETPSFEDVSMEHKVLEKLGCYYDAKKESTPHFDNHYGYSAKALWLFDVISNYLDKLRLDGFKKQPSAIVFVKERATAKALEIYLQVNFPEYSIGSMVGNNLRSLPLIPQNSPSKQMETMNDFKLGKKAVIVSTSVLEEGVDVQTCDLVVRFDKIETFQSYVQSKGRARAKESMFVMMVDSREEHVWSEDHAKYRELESKGIELVHGSVTNSDPVDENPDLIPPYYSKPEQGHLSPRLTRYETVSLVHRYVNSLASDRFTTLVPEFVFVKRQSRLKSEIQCILTLPHGSVHRDPIPSFFCPSKKTAKESAAMEACKILHKKGVLDDRFKLINPEKLLGLESDDVVDGKSPKAGTKRCRRYYPVELPIEFKNFQVEKCKDGYVLKSDGTFYVYRLSLFLKEICPFALNVKKYRPYRPEQIASKLAIILAQPLPFVALGEMFLYPISGTVQAKFEFVACKSIISTSVYEKSMNFQANIMPFILQSSLPWTVSDGASSNYLISVIDQKGEFDVGLLTECLGESKKVKDIGINLRHLENAVIQPIHIQTDMYYFVENISQTETIESNMPGQNISYKDYYFKKYGFSLEFAKQPLLSISNAKREHFMFRYIREGVSTSNRNNDTKTSFPPESVKIQPIPASLWREVQMFPFAMRLAQSRIFIDKMRQKILLNTNFIDGAINMNGKSLFDMALQKCSKDFILPDVNAIGEAVTMLGAGLEYNLERLEFMGDSFLKFIVSIGLFLNENVEAHLFNEGVLTLTRSSIIGNHKLRNLMVNKDFVNLLMPEKFEPHRLWLSPRQKQLDSIEKKICDLDLEFRLNYDENREGKRKKLPNSTIFSFLSPIDIEDFRKGNITPNELLKIARDRHQREELLNRIGPREQILISDKSIADSAEALFGLILISNGHLGTLEFMHWLGIDLSPKLTFAQIVQGDCIQPPNFDWYLKMDQNEKISTESGHQINQEVEFHLKKANSVVVEERLNYTFKRRKLLLEALTHGSYSSNTITASYENLEFLGDAVVDYLVTSYLYSNDDTLSPGQLTEKRSVVVCNNSLAFVCIKNSLQKNLLHQCPQLLGQIEGYLGLFEGLHFESKGGAESGVEEALKINLKLINEGDDNILEGIEIPKALGDIVESLIGAVFLDSGGSLLTCWKVLQSLFEDDLKALTNSNQVSPVKVVLEMFPGSIVFEKRPQKKGYAVCCAILQTHIDEEPKEFYGFGKNNKLARLSAARQVLRSTGKTLS